MQWQWQCLAGTWKWRTVMGRVATFLPSTILLLLLCHHSADGLQTRMQLVYKWRFPDFAWRSPQQRADAVRNRSYNPSSALPIGVEAAGDRLFISYGSFWDGAPATLSTVPRTPQNSSAPLLTPYPSWDWQLGSSAQAGPLDCSRVLVNVLRPRADRCGSGSGPGPGRLWVVDGGRHAYFSGVLSLSSAVCPPKLVVFDLDTDSPVRTYTVPRDQYIGLAIPVSVTVDTRSGCDDAFAYWADSISYTLTVYSWRSNSSWVIRHSKFTPTFNPISSLFLYVQGFRLPVPDGIYGLTLSAPGTTPVTGQSSVFFHTLASFTENWVPTDVLQDPKASQDGRNFLKLGDRGSKLGQKAVGVVDSRGIMFYTLANLDAVACWDTRRPYRRDTQAVLSRGSPGTLYPSGLVIAPSQDDPGDEELWLMTSAGLRAFAPGPFSVSPRDYNVFIYRARVKDLSKGSKCEGSSRSSGR